VAISNSEISTFDRCRRKWYLAYYLGMVPSDDPPVGNAILGTRVHAALEGYYGYQLDPSDVLNVLYALEADASPDWKTELMAEREIAVTMVTGYLEWVAETGEDANLRVVAVEQDAEVPLPGMPGVLLKARMDQVVYSEETGMLSFLDHKTAATFDSHDIMDLNPQFKFYSIVQRLLAGPDGPPVSGGIINTLRRVKRTERSKPPYYRRDGFRYNDVQLIAALERVTAIAGQIRQARAMLDDTYQRAGGDLHAVNALQRRELYPSPIATLCRWDCPFVAICPAMDDGSDWPGIMTRSGKYRQDNPYRYYRNDPLRAVRDALGKG
jgi:PD-(D/E)XK nuclease superfamily